MVKIDLITGFLGAGKTTFVKQYANYLLNAGYNIGILENDFGAVNVDMMLLQDLMGEHCELEMVAGGCDYDCHKRRFKTKLISMGMCGYDRVLVEPSGIYDVDEFFDVLQEEPLDRWYEIGNVFSIVDANLEENLSEQAQYLLASQVTQAGKILFSHTDLCTPKECIHTMERLNQMVERFHGNRKFTAEDSLTKSWDTLQPEEWEALANSGYTLDHISKLWFEQEKTFDSCYFMNLSLSKEALLRAVKEIFADASCGEVFRIKGFVQYEDSWIELNATRQQVKMEPLSQGQDVIIVIGEHLEEAQIKQCLERACLQL